MTNKVIKKTIVGIIAIIFSAANAWNVLEQYDIDNRISSIGTTPSVGWEWSDYLPGSKYREGEHEISKCTIYVDHYPVTREKEVWDCIDGAGDCVYGESDWCWLLQLTIQMGKNN